MAHPTQRAFFQRTKAQYPHYFEHVSVLDFGSLDVNGSLKEFFKDSQYIGIDINQGRNVDVVCKAHEYNGPTVDTIVSGEMLEHDEFYKQSLDNMYRLLKPGGIMIISAAGKSRPEHGTKRIVDVVPPGFQSLWGTSPDYYRNILEEDFKEFIANHAFESYNIESGNAEWDVYFYGIKPMENKRIEGILMDKKTSIIIPTCTSDHFLKCKAKILEHTDMTNIEIIAVANGYDGPDEDFEGCRLIRYQNKIGYTKATNIGIQASTAEFVILLNDDTELLAQPRNQWIEFLMAPFLQDEKMGGTGVLTLKCPYAEREFLVFFCVMIRRRLFDELGLLDEIFSPGGGEDTDFCIKMVDAGYKIRQVPNSNHTMGPGYWINSFPIWHAAEKTVGKLDNWAEIIDNHRAILQDRYKLPYGWFYPGDITEYRRLMEKVPDGGTVGELGVAVGKSLCSVADIIRRKKLNLIAVDTFKGTESEKTPEQKQQEINYRPEFEKHMRRFRLSPTIYAGLTTEVVKQIPDETFDLLFIDADHVYEAVKQDIKDWLPKVKKSGTIAGHDYGTHQGVMKAVQEAPFPVHTSSYVWSSMPGHHISVSLCTRGRYTTTLPLAMASLVSQTRLPDFVYIYDDTPKEDWVDLREVPILKRILQTYDKKGIGWYIMYGHKKGQHFGDQEVNQRSKDLVWRYDDDCIADANTLEELEKAMTNEVGAVACSIIDPSNPVSGTATGRLANIATEPNMQWVGGAGEVEHLHSSFLYRAHVADFDLTLSPRSFRGETMFSHEIMRKGYKLKVINTTTIWHYQNTQGGCRAVIPQEESQAMYNRDEAAFQKWLISIKHPIYYLDAGLGDHIVFRKLLDDCGVKDASIACCYAEVFAGTNYKLMSLAEAQKLGHSPDKHNVYAWMIARNWDKPLYQAYKEMYQL